MNSDIEKERVIMSNNNGDKERSRWCPMLKEWCGEEELGKCSFRAELTRQGPPGTMSQMIRVCGLEAALTILSEINANLVRSLATNQGEQKVKIFKP